VRVALGIQKSTGFAGDVSAYFDNIWFGDYVYDFNDIEGIWANPAEIGGQGLMFDYGPSFDLVFLAWFTDVLDSIIPTTPPQGRRLLTSLLSINGAVLSGTLRINLDDGMGGVVANDLGQVEITMVDCDIANVAMHFTGTATDINFTILPLEQQVAPFAYACTND